MTTSAADAALAALRARFAHRYTIHLCGSLWVANPRTDETNTAPTIIESDLNLFVRALLDPPARVGRPLSCDGKDDGFLAPGLTANRTPAGYEASGASSAMLWKVGDR